MALKQRSVINGGGMIAMGVLFLIAGFIIMFVDNPDTIPRSKDEVISEFSGDATYAIDAEGNVNEDAANQWLLGLLSCVFGVICLWSGMSHHGEPLTDWEDAD